MIWDLVWKWVQSNLSSGDSLKIQLNLLSIAYKTNSPRNQLYSIKSSSSSSATTFLLVSVHVALLGWWCGANSKLLHTTLTAGHHSTRETWHKKCRRRRGNNLLKNRFDGDAVIMCFYLSIVVVHCKVLFYNTLAGHHERNYRQQKQFTRDPRYNCLDSGRWMCSSILVVFTLRSATIQLPN